MFKIKKIKKKKNKREGKKRFDAILTMHENRKFCYNFLFFIFFKKAFLNHIEILSAWQQTLNYRSIEYSDYVMTIVVYQNKHIRAPNQDRDLLRHFLGGRSEFYSALSKNLK